MKTIILILMSILTILIMWLGICLFKCMNNKREIGKPVKPVWHTVYDNSFIVMHNDNSIKDKRFFYTHINNRKIIKTYKTVKDALKEARDWDIIDCNHPGIVFLYRNEDVELIITTN